jgi:hypothetical protein
MSSETTGQSDVIPDHLPVTEQHAVSGEWAVLHSTLGPTCHMHEMDTPNLSWSNTNPFHSPISHPLSLKEQEWGRTREKMKVGNGDEGGRGSVGMQSKIIISSRSSHPYLMIMVSSWALISLVEDFSQTLISTSHACMEHGVWWPLIHHKGKVCSTSHHEV